MIDLKALDKMCDGLSKYIHNFMLFEVRDKMGIYPVKIRTQVITQDSDGSFHTCETETIVNITDELEESYYNEIKRRSLDEARKIIKDG